MTRQMTRHPAASWFRVCGRFIADSQCYIDLVGGGLWIHPSPGIIFNSKSSSHRTSLSADTPQSSVLRCVLPWWSPFHTARVCTWHQPREASLIALPLGHTACASAHAHQGHSAPHWVAPMRSSVAMRFVYLCSNQDRIYMCTTMITDIYIWCGMS